MLDKEHTATMISKASGSFPARDYSCLSTFLWVSYPGSSRPMSSLYMQTSLCRTVTSLLLSLRSHILSTLITTHGHNLQHSVLLVCTSA